MRDGRANAVCPTPDIRITRMGRGLATISEVLDRHSEFVDWIAEDVDRGRRSSMGRAGLPYEVILRLGILKQLWQSDYRELEFALADSASAKRTRRACWPGAGRSWDPTPRVSTTTAGRRGSRDAPAVRRRPRLDLGCGWGTITFAMARYAGEVVGLDYAPPANRVLQRGTGAARRRAGQRHLRSRGREGDRDGVRILRCRRRSGPLRASVPR